jgi:deoxyribonuclease V
MSGGGDRHAWDLSPREAVRLQRRLCGRVRQRPLPARVRLVAGLDAAFPRDGSVCLAAAVLWDTHSREVVEQRVARHPLRFPYVPGLLSFREAPAVLAALGGLETRPDVVICDGHGMAHPRRFGLACHVGVLSGLPTIGCAKSRLVGEHREPAVRRGSRARLIDRGETVGYVVRTRDGVRPVFVSVGHLADLDSAVRLVLRCATGFRLPEPTRRADRLAARPPA